jgi:hypothetical protein
MGDTYAIAGLRRKRARIAGEIIAAQRALDRRREDLAQIDAVLRIFAADCDPEMIPAIRPSSHGLFFSHGQLPRLCLTVLREAGGPKSFGQIADQVAAIKGLLIADGHVRKHVRDTIRATLVRMERRGIVRRIIREPDTWWELVG